MPTPDRHRNPATGIMNPSALIILPLMAILASGCRQDSAALEVPMKPSIALATGACGQGLLAVSAWECLSGSIRSARPVPDLGRP